MLLLAMARSSPWRLSDTLCSSGFMDDVIEPATFLSQVTRPNRYTTGPHTVGNCYPQIRDNVIADPVA